MSLRLQSVSYTYADKTPMAQPALDDVSVELESGTLAVVTGPTGSGKTTLLRLAAGLLLPSGGSIEIDGRPAGALRDFRGQVALAFQRPESQFFAPTVLEDVAFGPRNLGRDERTSADDARSALEAVGLGADEFGGRSPFTLSGGEARRVALAGVLALRPSYLLLDEPTAGLDGPGRVSVLAAVREARRTAGVMVVTHEADDFLADADRAVVLRAGRSAFDGDVAELLAACAAESGLAGDCPSEVTKAQVFAARRLGVTAVPQLDPERAADSMVRAAGMAP